MPPHHSAPLRSRVETFAIQLTSYFVGRQFAQHYQQMQEAQWAPGTCAERTYGRKIGPTIGARRQTRAVLSGLLQAVGPSVECIGGVEDLRHLPVMTKSAYQEYGLERFLAPNLPTHQRLESATSGSTGDPFRFYLDREASPIVFASHLFYDSWFQLKPFDRHMRILPPTAEEPSFVGNASLPVRARQLARSKLQGLYECFTQKRINLWNINSVAAEQIHQEIEKFQPDYILGYSSSLSTIADLLLQKNLLLSRPMKGSITTAETLTVPRQRLIKEYFRGPIINRYGLREFKYWSAQNCAAAADKFHVNTELVVPEVVRLDGTPASPGELGRLVMTNLFNYVMPFIRYDTGDLAIVRWTQCSCGRGFPQI